MGRTMHLGVRHGDVANRILSVGDEARAARLAAALFDTPDSSLEGMKQNNHQKITSTRGFVTHTGNYQGVPMSIIATGMGMAMMDFMVRETRAVTDGDMAMVRLGTCGGLKEENPVGTIVVAERSRAVIRNYDVFHSDSISQPAYNVSSEVAASDNLYPSLQKHLAESLGADRVKSGLNLTADTFYASQGRVGTAFEDHNEGFMDKLCAAHPDALSLEMESFCLLHLGLCARKLSTPANSKPMLYTAATAIVLANRQAGEFLSSSILLETEVAAGEAILKTLKDTPLNG